MLSRDKLCRSRTGDVPRRATLCMVLAFHLLTRCAHRCFSDAVGMCVTATPSIARPSTLPKTLRRAGSSSLAPQSCASSLAYRPTSVAVTAPYNQQEYAVYAIGSARVRLHGTSRHGAGVTVGHLCWTLSKTPLPLPAVERGHRHRGLAHGDVANCSHRCGGGVLQRIGLQLRQVRLSDVLSRPGVPVVPP